MLREIFRQRAERERGALRAFAGRVSKQLERGFSLEAALEGERNVLPPLFLAMVSVGEATGHLPEVLAELEAYYRGQQQMRRHIRARTIVPVLQFFLAVLIVAGLFMVLGWISAARGTAPPSLLGASGAGAAGRLLLVVFGGIVFGYAAYLLVARRLLHRPAVDLLLLRCPRVGPCLQALALGRFALALQVTLDSSMSLVQAMRLSLAATGNSAFARCSATVERSLTKGDDLTSALTELRIFPSDFLNMVAVGEEGGRVPEIMRHQARHYHDEAQRRLSALTRTVTGAVWLAYAVFMALAIFKIAGVYLGTLGA